MLIAAGLLCAAIWIYLAAFRGGFWQLRERLGSAPPNSRPVKVAAIIPARNEAEYIGATVASLRTQEFNGKLKIFVADDESSDDTGNLSRADQVTTTPPRPQGWKGKLWAVQSAIAAAQAFDPDYYLITDADILYESPYIVNALIAQDADLASVMVRLECRSAAEKFLIPAFVFFFFMLYPPRWGKGAAGGCMLIRRTALEHIGGIESIRGALIDDCALAARVRSSGGSVWLGLSRLPIRSARPYTTLLEIHSMIARAAFAQLRHSALLLIGTVIGMLLTYALPIMLLFSGNIFAALLGVFAWRLSAFLFTPIVREYRAPYGTVFALPVIAMFYMRATIFSALNYWSGRGGLWKGRHQDARE